MEIYKIHALGELDKLGVSDPVPGLLRAQLLLEHAKNMAALASRLPVSVEPFAQVEEVAQKFRNDLLALTPVGSSAGLQVVEAMARDAAQEVGAAKDVHVYSAQPFSSRYVQYLLRTADGANPYHDGQATIVAVSANGKRHTFPRPVLVAAGAGLADARKPYDWRVLVRALHAAGLQTNDDGGVPDDQICAAGWPLDVPTHPPDTIPCAHHPDRDL